MKIIDLLTVSVISFGLAFSFALTTGPFGLFKKTRKRLETLKWDWISEGVQCPICLSFWLSAIVSLLLDCGVEGWLFSFGFTCLVTSLSPE